MERTKIAEILLSYKRGDIQLNEAIDQIVSFSGNNCCKISAEDRYRKAFTYLNQDSDVDKGSLYVTEMLVRIASGCED